MKLLATFGCERIEFYQFAWHACQNAYENESYVATCVCAARSVHEVHKKIDKRC